METRLDTEFPVQSDGEYHIRLREGDIPPYVFLPGSPERVDLFTEIWDDAVNLKQNREFRSAKGKYQGIDMACVSTGIGTTSAEICIHEINKIGAHTAIRIGTTGSISERFMPGDLIVPVAAIRADGTSSCYVGEAFPAVADIEVVNALGEACERLGFSYGYGIMYSPSSLYIGQGRPIKPDGYWPEHARKLIGELRQMRVTNLDTDSAGQFIVGYMHGMRMGSILSVVTNRIENVWAKDDEGERRACLAACEAVKILRERDSSRKKYRK